MSLVTFHSVFYLNHIKNLYFMAKIHSIHLWFKLGPSFLISYKSQLFMVIPQKQNHFCLVFISLCVSSSKRQVSLEEWLEIKIYAWHAYFELVISSVYDLYFLPFIETFIFQGFMWF